MVMRYLTGAARQFALPVLVIGLFTAFPSPLFAQRSTPAMPTASPQTDSPSNGDSQVPSSLSDELRIKREIKYAEKEHHQNLARAKEIYHLGNDLAASFDGGNSLDREAIRKIDKLEKLIKRIRSDAGGSDDEIALTKKPNDLAGALKCIAEASASLSDRVQGTPRRVVSAQTIEKANVLLELIRIVRSLTRQV